MSDLSQANANELFEAGRQHFEHKDYSSAIAVLGKAVAIDPCNSAAHRYLGKSYLELELPDKAIEPFEIALKLEGSEEHFLGLCRAFCDNADLHAAEQVALSGLHEHEQSAELHFYLGLVYYLKGSPGLALCHYRKAVEINPDHEMALCNIGSHFARQGSWAVAYCYFHKSFMADGTDPDVVENLLTASYQLQKPGLVRQWAATLLPLRPDSALLMPSNPLTVPDENGEQKLIPF